MASNPVYNSFPGVYTTVRQNSFQEPVRSRFRCGAVGVASRGPFNVPVRIRSRLEFERALGKPIDGHYLSDAALMSEFSDGCTYVRVGRQYEEGALGSASGAVGTFSLITPDAGRINPGDYVRVTEVGKPSTVNAKVESVDALSGLITLVSVGAETSPLAATYNAANVDHSPVPNAANEAESFLYGYIYGDPLVALGNVVGDKNGYSFSVDGDHTLLLPGDLIRIDQPDRRTTREVRVRQVRNDKVIFVEPTNRTDIGYLSLPLQENYTLGVVRKVTGVKVVTHMLASSAGTWANDGGRRSGITVKVGPGSKADSKVLLVYLDGGLIERIDGLNNDPASPDYIVTRINGRSDHISLNMLDVDLEMPANTIEPWNKALALQLNPWLAAV
jgi:hypothetical protein